MEADKPNLVKAEVLITRKCQLRCKGCKIPDNKYSKELSLEQWKKAFKIVYMDLNADFQAIYGGDPMMLGREGLKEVVRELSSYRPLGKSYTIISNSLGLYNGNDLDKTYMKELMDAGLDSWTASVDAIGSTVTIGSGVKSFKGLQALLQFKEMGLRDCCGIVTVSKKNLDNVVGTVGFLNEVGCWSGLDFIHYQKCPGQKDLPKKEEIEDLAFTEKDTHKIAKVAEQLIQMKKKGALIFPTYEVLEAWKNGDYSVNLNWQCQRPIRSITIDSDGTLMQCDSFRGERVKRYSIFDMPEKWEKFEKDYFRDIQDQDCRCFWSTHKMLFEKDRKSKEGVDYYQHKTK